MYCTIQYWLEKQSGHHHMFQTLFELIEMAIPFLVLFVLHATTMLKNLGYNCGLDLTVTLNMFVIALIKVGITAFCLLSPES